MNNVLQKTLTKALALILRPLVRLWMKKGYSFRAFEEIIRWVFVSVAVEDFPINGKKQTDSRISVITGLTRHQVNHYRSINLEQSPDGAKSNRSTRVLTGWASDEEFINEQGEPAVLRVTQGKSSFQSLVKKYGGDISHKAVLDELLLSKCVECSEKDEVTLISHGYVPREDETALIEIIGRDASTLLGTLEHNLGAEGENTYFQKKVLYNRISTDHIPDFKDVSSERAQKLLEELNKEMKGYRKVEEGDEAPHVQLGMGVYYFERESIT